MSKTPLRYRQRQTSRYVNTKTCLQALEAAYEKELKNFAHRFILVLLPQNAPDCRQAVKYWGDVEKGVTTQCVVSVPLHVPLNQLPHSSPPYNFGRGHQSGRQRKINISTMLLLSLF